MKRIFVHIGFPKTASTTIQSSLYHNQQLLLEDGVVYPGSIPLGHPNVAHDINNDLRYNPDYTNFSTLRELIAQVEQETVIISSEDFSISPPDAIRKLNAGLEMFGEIRIIVFLRRQDSLLQSQWAQFVKIGHTQKTFREFLDDAFAYQDEKIEDPMQSLISRASFPDYAARLKPWEAVFSRENIHLVPFEPAQIKENVFYHVLELLGISSRERYILVNENITSDAKMMEVVRSILLKTGGTSLDRNRNLGGKIAQFIREYAAEHNWQTGKHNEIDQALHDSIMAKVSASNAELARAYFDREELFLEPFTPAPIHKYEMSSMIPEELSDLLSFIKKRLQSDPESQQIIENLESETL